MAAGNAPSVVYCGLTAIPELLTPASAAASAPVLKVSPAAAYCASGTLPEVGPSSNAAVPPSLASCFLSASAVTMPCALSVGPVQAPLPHTQLSQMMVQPPMSYFWP